MSDDNLVVRARSDRTAFGQLYDRYYPRVMHYCLRRLFVRSPLQAVSAMPDITGAGFETFGAPDIESTYATAHPVTIPIPRV